MKFSLPKRRTITGGIGIKKRQKRFLLLSIISLIGLLYIFFSVPPTMKFSFMNLSVSVVPLFFVLFGITVFSLISFIFGSKKHGILVTIFSLLYLWMRMNNLLHPLFAILTVALFLTLELLFSAKKEE